MCKVSREAVIRANNSTRSHASSHSSPISNNEMSVTVRYNGSIYSKQISLREAKTSFAKAMSNYGKKL